MLHRGASASMFSTTGNGMQQKNQQILHKQQPVGERLRWLRENNRQSLEAFGAAIGYDKSYLSRLERGHSRTPSLKFVDALCSKYPISREWLLSGSGEPFLEAVANATQSLPASSVEEQILSRLSVGSRPQLESLMKSLCIVEGVRLLILEMSDAQRLQKYQEVVDSPAITPGAQVFWLLALTKAMRGIQLTPFGISVVEAARKQPARQKKPQDAMQK